MAVVRQQRQQVPTTSGKKTHQLQANDERVGSAHRGVAALQPAAGGVLYGPQANLLTPTWACVYRWYLGGAVTLTSTGLLSARRAKSGPGRCTMLTTVPRDIRVHLRGARTSSTPFQISLLARSATPHVNPYFRMKHIRTQP